MSGIGTRVLPNSNCEPNIGGSHGSWNSAVAARSPNSDHYSSRYLAALNRRGVLRDIVQLVLSEAALAVSRRTPIDGSACAKQAAMAKLHLIATALLQFILLEPTRSRCKFGRVRSCIGLLKPERGDGKRRRHQRKKFDRRASVTPVRNNGPSRKSGKRPFGSRADHRSRPPRQRKNNRCIAGCRA